MTPTLLAPTKISGVSLEDLAASMDAAPQAAMVVAICDDKYRANYPREYVLPRIIRYSCSP